jgi:FGGY-family pentulose kinase
MMERHYLGIDVGTASARAGIFDAQGRCAGTGVEGFEIFRPRIDFVEQSSDDIWRACGVAVRAALAASGLKPEAIAGIGFDATCSLVALDERDRPVTVSPTGQDRQNVIVWMDHRAIEQAERINAGRHDVLRYVGGVISPEMETPKLLWLKENLPKTWERAARFFDLPDFLAYRATGVDVRSLCTTVCKWTYLGHEDRWDEPYFRAIGLGDLAAEKWRRIGTRVRPMGERQGALTEAAAAELGLVAGIAVGVSIIDAHAGGIGMLGVPIEREERGSGEYALAEVLAEEDHIRLTRNANRREPSGRVITGDHGRVMADPVDDPHRADFDRRIALISGTSSCHMAVSREARFVGGVWGPYFSAMVPGYWLNEGGQSATGALIDHVVRSHARAAELDVEARRRGTSAFALLDERLESLAAGAPFPAALTKELHVFPDFHGNRSPRADPTLRGGVVGLKLDDTVDSLALLYLATVQAIAHGTRHIVDTLNDAGYRIDTLVACGGDTKNPTFLREHADVTGARIVLPREPEAVLLGSAILGAVASGDFATVAEAMQTMTASGRVIEPTGGEVRAYHDRKHRIFHRMHDDQLAYRREMND